MKRVFSLRGGSGFQRVWDAGQSWSHPLIVLRACPNGMETSRFGFVVGKKIGKAVTRNRAKRLIREVVRHRLEKIAKGWDLIFVARAGAGQAEFKEIEQAVEQVLQRAGLQSL